LSTPFEGVLPLLDGPAANAVLLIIRSVGKTKRTTTPVQAIREKYHYLQVCRMCDSGAMFIFVLLAILLLVLFWQYILAGLALWVLVLIMRAVITWTVADAKPSYPRNPVRTRPAAKPVQTRPAAKPIQTRPVAKPKPVRELPAPAYLPRWTASRRLDAGREHAQWQKMFDNAAQ